MRSVVERHLQALHGRFQEERGGQVADYIPELRGVDPDGFGICLATADGRLYEVGDTRVPFTIQSISKPFTYGLALRERGRDVVLQTVGVEPSGEAFNSISLAPESGQPLNPMINAGAIATVSLIGGATPAERFERVLSAYSRHAGRQLSVDLDVFRSERETGHRNRAIGHMLRTFDVIGGDPDDTLDVYFRQCSVSVDCRDIALMAATLANGGEQPLTGERVLEAEQVQHVLSVMTTCGMYDGSGSWVDEVGLPAKSGVGGGILAVLPGQFGLAVFSPRLDVHGNSVRGVAVCRALTSDLQLHSLRVARASRSVIRTSYDLVNARSHRRRDQRQTRVLDAVGHRAQVWELQGDILFAGVEAVLRAVEHRIEELDVVVLDLRAVTGIGPPARRMLAELGDELADAGKELVLVGGPDAGWQRIDDALEHCERRLLATEGADGTTTARVPLVEQALCRGLDQGELALLERVLRPRTYTAGELLASAGESAHEIFLLVEGEVTFEAVGADGSSHRIATLLPGSTFGELAVLTEAGRTVNIRAGGEVSALILSAADFADLERTGPRLQARLVRNMLAGTYESIARATRDVASRRTL